VSGRVAVRRTDRCVHILLDRPSAKNALTLPMLDEFNRVVGALGGDAGIDVVVIAGAGTDFCTGSDVGDIKELLARDPVGRAAAFEDGMRSRIQPLMRGLLDLPQVVVASARGHAIGLGAAFILAADLTVLSQTLRPSLPQVRLGHTVDHGESWLLPRKVGLGPAMRLALLGEPLSWDDAQRVGLATHLVTDDRLDDTTDDVVRTLLSVSSASLRGTKRLLARSLDQDRAAQFAEEVRTAAQCAATPGFVSAVEAQLGWHRAAADG
jgi:2-(1,2-epoxy-1,2-dihydrophenyl)acetyl-CoA isomerase